MNNKLVLYPILSAFLTAFLFWFLGPFKWVPVIDAPTGAVVAFHLEQCPDGWSDFLPADGRFIFGMNQQNITDSRKLGETGGQESVILTIDQLPKHNHQNPMSGSIQLEREVLSIGSSTFKGSYSGKHSRPTDFTGSDTSHENMPPFIVLKYCKRV